LIPSTRANNALDASANTGVAQRIRTCQGRVASGVAARYHGSRSLSSRLAAIERSGMVP
jgi:hypothetical protein